MAVRRVSLIDCTLREGDQAPGVWLDSQDKRSIFRLLDGAGVALVDAGMPAISQDERELLAALARLPERRARVAASVRALPDEIRLATLCRVDEVFIIFPVSELHRARLGMDRAGWRRLGSEALGAARAHGLVANLVLEDASRAAPEDLEQAMELARAGGAPRVMACDTVGVLTPSSAAALVSRLRELGGDDLEIGTHFHNDFGMATANTVAAVEAGATHPSVTVNGLGERAGNAPLAEVAAACQRLLGVDAGIDLAGMQALSSQVEALAGVAIPQAAPIVGARTFDHESGIHVDGLLKDPRSYEPLDPAVFGRQRALVLGKHSGRAGLAAFARAQGLPTDAQTLGRVLATLKERRPAAQRERIQRHIERWRAHLASGDPELEAEALSLLKAAVEESAA